VKSGGRGTRRIALYARVSTSEQTVAPQLDSLRAYAHAQGFEVEAEYVDHGFSGAADRRPALDRLLTDARRGRFNVLAIVKLDRLARSVRHLTTLAADLEALGIDLVVLDQAIDTTTPSGRFLFNVLGAVAEFERDLVRERTRAGLAAARRRGKRIGRPRVHVPRGSSSCSLGEGALRVCGGPPPRGVTHHPPARPRPPDQKRLPRNRCKRLISGPNQTRAAAWP
jgi:DNA invertase Pin-like site-specific DNA recombinase